MGWTPEWAGTDGPAAGAQIDGARALRCLLDLDPDLGEALTDEARRPARAAATAIVLDHDPGPVPVSAWTAQAAGGPGVLVLDGVLTLSVQVADRVCAELLGPGDLLPAPARTDALVACATRWRALTSVRLALLDGAFARRVRFWPELGHALAQRSAARALRLDVQRAITAQPRLEVRLALLLWHFADRWGRVERGGVRLALPLTHQLLGQLVGAERPSVSHALARLARSGLVTGHADEWHLHGQLDAPEPDSARAGQIVAALEARRRGEVTAPA